MKKEDLLFLSPHPNPLPGGEGACLSAEWPINPAFSRHPKPPALAGVACTAGSNLSSIRPARPQAAEGVGCLPRGSRPGSSIPSADPHRTHVHRIVA